MTKNEAISYLESCSWSDKKLGLDREKTLLRVMGDPQERLKFIHVAGSNGKGSTCAMFAAILRAAGYRVGLFTSPHIEQFCERIQVDGEMIGGEALAALTAQVKAAAETMAEAPSQFELVTAIGLTYFAQMHCDIVVLEVGMGGAYDSTNAIHAPELAVITNIALEHTEYLGTTLEAIAATKAGIIKPGCRCVCYDGAPEVTAVIRQVCTDKGVSFNPVDIRHLQPLSCSLGGQDILWRNKAYHLALLGQHQMHNAAAVLTGIELLQEAGWRIPPEAVAQGLSNVRWPARFEVLRREPLFILDGGHNPQCAQALRACLDDLFPGEKVTFLMGVLADKDYAAIIDTVLPCAKEFVCVFPQSPRGLAPQVLCDYLKERGAAACACDTVELGIRTALSRAGNGITVAFGSLYLAGTIRTALRK